MDKKSKELSAENVHYPAEWLKRAGMWEQYKLEFDAQDSDTMAEVPIGHVINKALQQCKGIK